MIYEERYLKFVGEKKFLIDKLFIPLGKKGIKVVPCLKSFNFFCLPKFTFFKKYD